MSKTIFLVIQTETKTPVLTFFTKRAVEQFCSQRPDLTWREFTVPSESAEHEDIKNSLRDLFALKQELRGGPTVAANEATELDALIEGRCKIHRAFLEIIWRSADQVIRLGGEHPPEIIGPERAVMGMMSLP